MSRESDILTAERCIADGEADIALECFLRPGFVRLEDLQMDPEVRPLLADILDIPDTRYDPLIKPAVFKAAIAGGILATIGCMGYTIEKAPTNEAKFERGSLIALAGGFGTAAVGLGLEGISNFRILKNSFLDQRLEEVAGASPPDQD